MEKLRVVMIPVDQAMAKKKHWDHMPLDELVAVLNEKANCLVLRVDRPTPTTREQVVEDLLFFEVAFYYVMVIDNLLFTASERRPSSAAPTGQRCATLAQSNRDFS